MLKKVVFLITLFTVFPALSNTYNFSNGIHLINRDARAYTIRYTEYLLTTRICNCVRPTPTMKNGLVPASMRARVKGFTIVAEKNGPHLETEITAKVDPRTEVRCLGVFIKSIEVIGSGKLNGVSDAMVIIEGGKVRTEPLK